MTPVFTKRRYSSDFGVVPSGRKIDVCQDLIARAPDASRAGDRHGAVMLRQNRHAAAANLPLPQAGRLDDVVLPVQ